MNKKLLLLLKKEEKLVLSGLIAGLSLFLIYFVFMYIPLFATQSKLFVRNIPLSSVVASYGEGSTIKSESGYSNPLFNLKQIVKSDRLATNLYKKFNSKYKMGMKKLGVKNNQQFMAVYKKLIKVKIEPSTDIIKISLKWPVKQEAQKVLDDIIAEFKSTNLEIRKSIEIKQREYMDRQLADVGTKLDSIRREIKDYKLNNGAVDVDNERLELTKARVALEKQIELISSEIEYSNQKFTDLSEQLGIEDAKLALRATAIGEDAYLIKLNQDLSEAEQLYANMQTKFTDKYPALIAVNNEIMSIKNNIAKRHEETLGTLIVERGIYDKPSQDIVTDMARVQAEKSSLLAKMDGLRSGVKNLKIKEAQLPIKKLGLEELQKQENALSTAYSNIKQKQLEASIRENQIVDNMIVIASPSYPNALFDIVLIKFLGFLFLGFFGGLGVAWVKDDILDRWSGSEEIEELTGQKVLGVIPWVKEENYNKRTLFHNSESLLGISYSNIALNIASKSYVDNAQAISFISTSPSRCKSSVIPNIAITLARLKRSVLIIDTDLAMSKQFFKSAPESDKVDLLDVISEINKQLRMQNDVNEEVINNILSQSVKKLSISGEISLSYLGSNKIVNNIQDYIATPGFKMMIDFLKKHFEFILIDTPSKPLIYPEFTAIADNTDAVVLISGLDTNKESLIKITENIANKGNKILGIIPREQNSEIEKHFNFESENVKSDKELAS